VRPGTLGVRGLLLVLTGRTTASRQCEPAEPFAGGRALSARRSPPRALAFSALAGPAERQGTTRQLDELGLAERRNDRVEVGLNER
jgi:hypothetical protein